MSSSPERKPTVLETVYDHAILSTLFNLGLITHPRAVLETLKKEGMGGIGKGYRIFFDNMRPQLGLFKPKK